ncbi:MAG TPA: DUF2202 domain-containing protein [Polyangiaceae bacterium LLY-WYZ-15_(1-7)]|nr:DUF2202 domain-containing protein [Polyangiaceae bacterium LLY-WYZ-15_(1-7)]HJL07337.1 DUF2202 domain-containing protein [Polyangiaceae bacterium LLY-WYZ-15_(1-7)]HJL27224.1 DUF2202 domain-containing protein [Polyangiaceae bacterium LLY-WYZ-15_(1-7)]HJL27681.1 DUF2202 domain-containing protein [Polyangiaceae bacterium LLY-WYZ-15_(1-7)]HJL34322.1 DUF2202 domain-containing protein [Polyangiaceae bacterium LLY-WYZ-15_(1-7)]
MTHAPHSTPLGALSLVVGALLAATSAPAEAQAPQAPEASMTDLVTMRREEKLARDVYLALAERHDLPIFEHIAGAEQRHMDAVGRLLARRDLADPIEGLERGQFGDPRFDRLYAELLAAGATLEGALRVGLRIEEMDIDDLREALDGTVEPDVQFVFSNLLRGSRNHLRAFHRQLARRGGTYTAQHLSQAELERIAASAHEPGPGGGRGRGRHGRGRGQGMGRGHGMGGGCCGG